MQRVWRKTKKKYWNDRQLHYFWNHIKYAKNNDMLWSHLYLRKAQFHEMLIVFKVELIAI